MPSNIHLLLEHLCLLHPYKPLCKGNRLRGHFYLIVSLLQIVHLCLQELLLALIDAVARLVQTLGGRQHALPLPHGGGVVVVLQAKLCARRRTRRSCR